MGQHLDDYRMHTSDLLSASMCTYPRVELVVVAIAAMVVVNVVDVVAAAAMSSVGNATAYRCTARSRSSIPAKASNATTVGCAGGRSISQLACPKSLIAPFSQQ